MTNYQKFNLRGNPFTITPPDNPENVVWAGMSTLRAEIEQVLTQARHTSMTQCVLNRGPFGGGKTHALRFYTSADNWPSSATNNVRHIHVIPISTPKETGKPHEDFYIDVLEKLGMQRIRDAVRDSIQEVGADEAQVVLQRITGSQYLAQAIYKLGEPNLSPDQAFLLDTYFLMGCTRTELRKLRLARNITNAQDRFRVLAGILRCFIGLSDGVEVQTHSRVCLWLDEFEDLVYFTSAKHRPFTQGLRDLIDRLPRFFTLIFNLTLTEPAEIETAEILMGQYLIDRITDHIIVSEMSEEQAKVYVEELLTAWRIEENASDLQAYPFTDDVVSYLIDTLDKRTPRAINKRFGNVLMAAIEHPDPISEIQLAFAKSVDSEQLEREFRF